mmetsp:Transcript_70988/g.139482  ORF Transcript_70988/g.139482 Transcript_70988/m.139482 type:complete len:291 (+) Transcript_70988:45-917(+)
MLRGDGGVAQFERFSRRRVRRGADTDGRGSGSDGGSGCGSEAIGAGASAGAGAGVGVGSPAAVAAVAASSEKTCLRKVAQPVRVWVSWPQGGYVHCALRVHLVVTKTAQGQTSHIAFSFRPATAHAAATPQASFPAADPSHQQQQQWQEQEQAPPQFQFAAPGSGGGDNPNGRQPAGTEQPEEQAYPAFQQSNQESLWVGEGETGSAPVALAAKALPSTSPAVSSVPSSIAGGGGGGMVAGGQPQAAGPVPPTSDLFVNATENFWDSVASITHGTAPTLNDPFNFSFEKV